MRAIGFWAWVHVPKKLKKKLTDRAWQGILVGYKRHNLFRIYHFLNGKIHKTRDVDIDKGFLYNKSEVDSGEFADAEWEDSDDSLFADPLKFDDNLSEKITTSNPTFGKKDIDLIKSGIGGNDVEFEASEKNSVADGNDSDMKSVLISVPDYIESSPRQSTCTCTKRILYPG